MTEHQPSAAYLAKATESLAGAESEYANGRFDNCANRAYYASFQAAIAALLGEGIRATGQPAATGRIPSSSPSSSVC